MRVTLATLTLPLLLLGCDDKKGTSTATPPPTTAKAPEPAKPADPPKLQPAEPAKPPEPAPTEAPKTEWSLWVHPDKIISAKFPKAPQQTEQEAPSPIGPVKFIMAMHAENTRAFLAGAARYAVPEGSTFDVAKALDGARDQMLANVKATATGEKAVKLDGMDGKEVEFEAPGPGGQKIRGIARVYASDSPPAGYFLGAFRMTEAADPDFVTFLDSAHVGKAAEEAK